MVLKQTSLILSAQGLLVHHPNAYMLLRVLSLKIQIISQGLSDRDPVKFHINY